MKSDTRFTISTADFLTTASGPEHFPPQDTPEVAFLGRSNVGKSSLLNALVGQKRLAYAGKTPGKTRHLNFFTVRFKDRSSEPPSMADLRFVDVPGYGYANVSKAEQAGWSRMISSYLSGRAPLQMMLLLVDGRREPGEEEHWIVEQAAGRELLLILTKSDKLARSESRAVCDRLASELGISRSDLFLTSTTKDGGGIEALRERLAGLAFHPW